MPLDQAASAAKLIHGHSYGCAAVIPQRHGGSSRGARGQRPGARPRGQAVAVWLDQDHGLPVHHAASATLPTPRDISGAAPGIEPGTSRTLSENHATRPSSQCCQSHPQVPYAVPSRRVRDGYSQRHGGSSRGARGQRPGARPRGQVVALWLDRDQGLPVHHAASATLPTPPGHLWGCSGN